MYQQRCLPALSWPKKFKEYWSEWYEIITLAKAPNYQPARAPTGLGPSLHAGNNSDKIFNIVGEGSDPSNSQNNKIQNNIGPSENLAVL